MKRTKKLLALFLACVALLSIAVFPANAADSSATGNTVYMAVKDYGLITIELYPDDAPITVQNFKDLVNRDFYDGLTFHRIVQSFMIQGGDPKGNGTGGSDKTIKGEFEKNGVHNHLKHVEGTISMARSNDYDSASSQFFIVTQTSETNTRSLDDNYAAFGQVISGMDVVHAIAAVKTASNNKPMTPVVIAKVTFDKAEAEAALAPAENTEPESSNKWIVFVVIGAVLAIGAVVIILLVIRQKKKKAKAAAALAAKQRAQRAAAAAKYKKKKKK